MPKEVREDLKEFDNLTQTLLFDKGIKTKNEAYEFFKKEWNPTDPFAYKDMEKAVSRTIDAVEKGETIGIFSDYDCDGIPAAAALTSLLKKVGVSNVNHYTPKRNTDGFGLNKEGIDYLKESTLLFVVDCGTNDVELIEYAKDKGMDVIIIDHHIADTPSKALAIINPALEGMDNLCACGCVYKFAEALLKKKNFNLPIGWEKWLLDLVCLSTISDMVPLLGENRMFVQFGIDVMRKSRRPGIQALCSVTRVNQKTIDEQSIAFMIASHINAASRINEGDIAYRLLTTESDKEAMELARKLQGIKGKVRVEVTNASKEINKLAKAKSKDNRVWVFGSRKWTPAILGLLSTKVSSEYGKGVFVWGMSDKGEIKGSCRSSNIDLFKLMEDNKEHFIEYGGHKRAGGFSIEDHKTIELEEILNKNVEVEDMDDNLNLECSIKDVRDVFKTLQKFSPFGVGNERPSFLIKNCKVSKAERFGKNKAHSRYVLLEDENSIDAISFFESIVEADEFKEVYGNIEYDDFQKDVRIKIEKIIR